jgi:hypothetical protein
MSHKVMTAVGVSLSEVREDRAGSNSTSICLAVSLILIMAKKKRKILIKETDDYE